ncbi:MAG: hypothetical protein FJ222_03930 [Lentisphaerae bacterium]|nr:hypothetical protein [Lentisphaerota bacterium]
MCNKKRLGQTAALLMAGMAVGLAGYAFAADSEVPVNWNVSPITGGAYRETFETAPTWDRLVDTASTNSRVTVERRSLGATWFPGATTKALTLPGNASYTNTLKYTGGSANVSFATNPVFVDMRVQFTAYEGAPSIGDAKLAVFVSAADKIHVVHDTGTTTNMWANADLLSAWHQLTVRMEKNGKCVVYIDDTLVTNNLTPVGGATELTSLVFTGGGYADDLYVSHGNPNYPAATPGAIPSGVSGVPSETAGSVTNWLANYFNDGRLAANADLTGIQLGRAYLLNMGPVNAPTDPVSSTTFGVSDIDMVTPTLVKVTCKLTVNGTDRDEPINGKLRLLGKTTVGGDFDTMTPDAVTPQSADFTGGEATYDFTVESGMKFFKAQIVE